MRPHARRQLGRFTASGFLSCVLVAAAGCGSTLRQVDVYKGESVQVSLRELADGGRARPLGFDQPVSLAPEMVQAMLGAVHFEEFEYFAWHDKGPLFTAAELSELAPKLAEGLRKATADQWVYFSVSGMRSWLGIATARLSDGICFVKDSKFNLVVGNFSFPLTQQATGTAEPSRMDPRDLKTLENVRLTAKAPEVRGAAPALVPGDRWLGRERTNWLVFDLLPAAVPSPRPQAVATTPAATPTAPPLPAVTAPAPIPAGAASAPAPADPEERLRRLRDLRDKGLITPEEYEKKRQEILKGL